jgi:hypothetical protein
MFVAGRHNLDRNCDDTTRLLREFAKRYTKLLHLPQSDEKCAFEMECLALVLTFHEAGLVRADLENNGLMIWKPAAKFIEDYMTDHGTPRTGLPCCPVFHTAYNAARTALLEALLCVTFPLD